MIAEHWIGKQLTGFLQSQHVLSCGLCSAVNRLGVLFYMVLYLSMMALGSLPVWRQEGILFARCAPALDWMPAVAQEFCLQACCNLDWSFSIGASFGALHQLIAVVGRGYQYLSHTWCAGRSQRRIEY